MKKVNSARILFYFIRTNIPGFTNMRFSEREERLVINCVTKIMINFLCII